MTPRRPGLTLVEVMLALGIMLIALVAIAHLIQVGSEAGYDARMNARAGRLAQGKMAEVESGVMPVQNGGGSGTYSGDDAGWSWAVDLEPQGPANTYLATVKITRTLRGKPFTFSLAQMIVDPAMMGSAAQAEQPTTDDTTAATTLSGVGGTGGVNGTGATTP